MEQIITNLSDIKESGSAIAREPDFVELYNAFEAHYAQYLVNTSDEIAKRTQRVLELKSLLCEDPLCEAIANQHDSKTTLPFRQGT